jgi:hypothetical protein
VGDIDSKVISTTENSNKFQKTRCWKAMNQNHGLNRRLTIRFKHDFLSYLAV